MQCGSKTCSNIPARNSNSISSLFSNSRNRDESFELPINWSGTDVNVVREPGQLADAGRAVCVALGMFDGVHLGHQQVLGTAVEDAQSQSGMAVAITFDQHPNAVVAPDRTPALIYSLSQKIVAIERLKVDTVLLIHFDLAFSRQPADAFVTRLADEVRQLRSIAVGQGFTFGYKRT